MSDAQSTSDAVPDESTDELTREWVREAVTMALYVSLSLSAVLLARPSGSIASGTSAAVEVFVTALALLVAHQLAFRLSTRLVNKGVVDAESLKLLGAQVIGGVLAATIAALPLLVLGSEGLAAAEFLLLAFVCATGYRAARSVPTSRWRAVAYMLGVVIVVVAIVVLKNLAGH